MQPSYSVLEQLFENAPRFLERIGSERAHSYEQLIDRAETIAHDLPEHDQIELLDGHPRIGAEPGAISEQSFREQGYDHERAATGLQERLDELNDEYERRFGFRFVIFVAGRPRSEIADILERRMSASRDEELARGLSDVFAIARDRLTRLQPVEQEVR
jgi:2-oxo-4-hydroxy-4-carboxy--5-ureidoimidazoline (OHCU) decarboxylase